MYVSHPTYQLIKVKNGKEKVIIETEAACVEKAIDYFFMLNPKAYGNDNYRIAIKKKEYVNTDW